MNEHEQRELQQELAAAGASQAEVKQLVVVASRVSQLKDKQSTTAQHMPKGQVFRLINPFTCLTAGAVIVALLVFISQTALPTSWLYPVQRVSDSVVVSIHPSYRATIMMKRAQQVNRLVAMKASSRQILATLTDYTSEAKSYAAMPRANYAAFTYCKTMLHQASSEASPEIQQAIASSLASLDTT